MSDVNEVRLSGTIHKLYRLKTKAGNSFAKVLLKVGKDTFWVLAYGNVASAITALKEGDQLAITGTAQMNNWKDDAGDWHNDFNAVAWSAEINGQQISYQKADTRSQQKSFPDQAPQPDSHGLSEFDAAPVGEVPF